MGYVGMGIDEMFSRISAELKDGTAYFQFATGWETFATSMSDAEVNLGMTSAGLANDWTDAAGEAFEDRSTLAQTSLRQWAGAQMPTAAVRELWKHVADTWTIVADCKKQIDAAMAQASDPLFQAANGVGAVTGLTAALELRAATAMDALAAEMTALGSSVTAAVPTTAWDGPAGSDAGGIPQTAAGTNALAAGGGTLSRGAQAGLGAAGALAPGSADSGLPAGSATGANAAGELNGAVAGGSGSSGDNLTTPAASDALGAAGGASGAGGAGGAADGAGAGSVGGDSGMPSGTGLAGLPTAPTLPQLPPPTIPGGIAPPPTPQVLPPAMPPLPVRPVPPLPDSVRLPQNSASAVPLVRPSSSGVGLGKYGSISSSTIGSRGLPKLDLPGIGGPGSVQDAGSAGPAQAARQMPSRPALTTPEAPLPPATTPTTAGNSGPSGAGSAPPPMMPPMAMGQGSGTPRPGTAERPLQGRGRPASKLPGVPPKLRGRAGKLDPTGGPGPMAPASSASRRRRTNADEISTVQLLDEELWTVKEPPAPSTPPLPKRPHLP